MQIPSLGQEEPLEKEMATHSSIPAWKIPWTEAPWCRKELDMSELLSKCTGARVYTHTHTHTHTHSDSPPFVLDLPFSEILWCLSRINPLIEGWWHTPGLQGYLNI